MKKRFIRTLMIQMINKNKKVQPSSESDNDAKPIVRRGGTLAIAWGGNGGFGYYSGYMKRLCLWRVAIYYLPEEIENTFKRLTDEIDTLSQSTKAD
jgi:hypothetical protein